MEQIKQVIKEIIETEPLKELGLRFVGVGADKVVFETPGSQKKLIKVGFNVLKKKISEYLYDTPLDERRWAQLHKERIDEEEEYEENMALVFGKEHFPRKGVFKAKIPLNKEILLKVVDENEIHLVENLSDDAVIEIEMLIETQLIAEELKDSEKFETRSFNADLITEKDFRGEGDILMALTRVREFIDSNSYSEEELEALEDESFRKVIEEIVTKIILYTKKTGLMIDIFGGNNITIFKKEDGSWDYHMLDVILPGSQKWWEKNVKNDVNLRLLRHYYSYFYAVNSLAQKLGIKDNLDIHDLNYFKDAEIPIGKFPEILYENAEK